MRDDRQERGQDRRPGGVRMHDDMEWIVPVTPVRDADARRRAPSPAITLPVGLGVERVGELRRGIANGDYASGSMMDAVARRLLDSGDL